MWKIQLSRFTYFSLCVLACFPLLNMKLSVYAIILFALLSVISGVAINKNFHTKFRARELAMLIAPFILILVRSWIFDRSEASMFYLEVSLSLAVFPIVFFLNPAPLDDNAKWNPYKFFVFAAAVTMLFGIIRSSMKLMQFMGPEKFWKTTSQMLADPSLPYYFRTLFEEAVNIHPTYASLYLGIAVLIVTSLFLKSVKSASRSVSVFYVFVVVLLFGMQVLLASRTPFVATIIGVMLLLFLHLRNKMFAVYTTVALVACSVLLVLFVPTFSARFKEISFSNAKIPTEQDENSFNLRAGIYKCSFNIIKAHWFLGVGPGNVQKELNSCYDVVSKEVYEDKNYNTHNQFLDYWAALGLAGPFTLLLIIVYAAVKNYRRKEFLPVAICLLFLICFMTENMLKRQNGVVCFGFFMGYFFYTNLLPGKPEPAKHS